MCGLDARLRLVDLLTRKQVRLPEYAATRRGAQRGAQRDAQRGAQRDACACYGSLVLGWYAEGRLCVRDEPYQARACVYPAQAWFAGQVVPGGSP